MVSSCSKVGSASDDIKNGFVYLEAKDSAVYLIMFTMRWPCLNSSMLQPFVNPGGDEADWRRLASMSDVVSMWGEIVYYIYTQYLCIYTHNIHIYIHYIYTLYIYIVFVYIYTLYIYIIFVYIYT